MFWDGWLGPYRLFAADTLLLFDLIFGTFANPAKADKQVGFHDGGSKKVGALLAGRLIA